MGNNVHLEQAHRLTVRCRGCNRVILDRQNWSIGPISLIAEEIGACHFCGRSLDRIPQPGAITVEATQKGLKLTRGKLLMGGQG